MFRFHVVTERGIISIVRIFIYRHHCFGGFFPPDANSCCFDIIVIHSKQGNILQDANQIKAATVMPSANSLFATTYTEADYKPIPTFNSPIPSELTNMEEANALILFRNANHVVFLRHSKHKQQIRHDAVDPFHLFISLLRRRRLPPERWRRLIVIISKPTASKMTCSIERAVPDSNALRYGSVFR